VVLASTPKEVGGACRPAANLRYLDLSVLLELWRRWGLDELLNELMPTQAAVVAPSLVACALSLQRCVEATPKCEAPGWFEATALPELLQVKPSHYNNTRLHRVLDELDAVGPALMRRLPRLYEEREGAFAALFVDVTDSFFVGHGPSLAEKAKTKEGRFERKINIVLLCNQRGYPIQWEVVPGRSHDSEPILNVFRTIRGLNWVGQAPVVCDRALGCTAHLREMLTTGVRFLTAVTRNEVGSYADVASTSALVEFEPAGGVEPSQEEFAQAVGQAARLGEQSGMKRVQDDLFFKDLGVVEYAQAKQRGETGQQALEPTPSHKTVRAMQLGRALRADLAAGRAINYRGAGAPYGLTKEQVCRCLRLTALVEDVQDAILRGEAVGLAENDLGRLARLEDPGAQRAEFARLVEYRAARPDRHQSGIVEPRNTPKQSAKVLPPLTVRAVLYFNPEMLVRQRLQAREALAQVEAFLVEQNRLLAAPQSRRKPATITADVLIELRKRELASVYDISIYRRKIGGKTRYQVELAFKREVWKARRALDGFCLLVGHPDLPHQAVDLCRLYRAKNAIEWDFRVIKSVVKLRPFYHRLDAKIRAHVTICTLALLIERTLDARLKAAGSDLSPVAALNALEGCRLNLYLGPDGQPPLYATNHTTPAQKAILRALRFQHLADEKELLDRIAPR
jgi:hypothetical protein